MKKLSDPRHQKRRLIVKELFAYSFQRKQPVSGQTLEIISQFPVIDQEITASAPEWPITRINKIDLAILRLAVAELVIKKNEPPKVIIDEAVELAKEFGGDNSPAFVNGVLGNIFQQKYKNGSAK